MGDAATSCRGCTFAEYTDHPNTIRDISGGLLPQIQTGCRANRLDLFRDRHEAWTTVEPYYSLSKFCNMYRGTDWVELNGDDPNKARKEVMPLFGIGIYDHPERTLEDLQKTVDSLANMDYPKEKTKVVISTFSSRGPSEVAHIVNKLQEDIYTSCAIFHLVDMKSLRDKEIFGKLIEASYFVRIEAGKALPPDIFNIIDSSQNDEVNSVVMYEGDGFSIIHKSAVNNLYLKFLDYDKLVDHTRGLAQEQNVYKRL